MACAVDKMTIAKLRFFKKAAALDILYKCQCLLWWIKVFSLSIYRYRSSMWKCICFVYLYCIHNGTVNINPGSNDWYIVYIAQCSSIVFLVGWTDFLVSLSLYTSAINLTFFFFGFLFCMWRQGDDVNTSTLFHFSIRFNGFWNA